MLEHFFEPASVAVIGASRDPAKVGHGILRNLLESECRIYPINPNARKIMGLNCYASVTEVKGRIDLAVVSVPAKLVLGVMKECGRKNIDSVIVITAGFKESGREGAGLEKELVNLSRRFKMRLLGPNCLGAINTHHRLNASFAAGMPQPGNIAFFSQSGALCTAILDWALKVRLGFSKFISLGNKADLNEVDLLKVLGNDPRTDVILGYIEGVNNGVEFMKVAREVSRKKPIIMAKSGGTAAGARAASSHTGSLAGSENAFQSAFLQSGIIRAYKVEDLFNYALAFSYQKLPETPKVAVITNAGGPGIIAADAIEKSGVQLASLDKKTMKRLKEQLPPAASIYNPIDIIGDANADRYEHALKTVMDDKNVSGIIAIFTPQVMSQPEETARVIGQVARKKKKPVFSVFMGGLAISKSLEILSNSKIPNYPYPEPAVSAIEAMVNYRQWRRRPEPKKIIFEVDKQRVRDIFKKMSRIGRSDLGEYAAREVISAYGFRVPGSIIASTASDAAFAASKIGYPVAMKIASPDILHKSDIGGVKVGVSEEKELRQTFHDMIARARKFMPEADIWGVSIQEMIEGGCEVIIGGVKDPQFGPLLMFGLGGIYVEVMKDVSFRLAPINEEDAGQMIKQVRSYSLLRGVRGQGPVDLDRIKECLMRVSQLVMDFPRIVELDINPLKVFPEGKEPIAIDARMTIEISDTKQKK